MEKAEDAGLDRAANVKGLLLEGLGQIGDDGVADLAAGRAIENQAQRAGGIVLADEDDGAMEEGAVEFPAIEKQAALQELGRPGHSSNA
jgi:hypothetical protein